MPVGGRKESEDASEGWHEAVKTELKRLIPDIRLEKQYKLGEKQSWGDLGRYQPDGALDIDGRTTFFEVESVFYHDKIIGDIISACVLNAERLIFIFSNKVDVWNGEIRVEATLYLAQIIAELVKRPLFVNALYIDNPKDLGNRLRNAGIV